MSYSLLKLRGIVPNFSITHFNFHHNLFKIIEEKILGVKGEPPFFKKSIKIFFRPFSFNLEMRVVFQENFVYVIISSIYT